MLLDQLQVIPTSISRQANQKNCFQDKDTIKEECRNLFNFWMHISTTKIYSTFKNSYHIQHDNQQHYLQVYFLFWIKYSDQYQFLKLNMITFTQILQCEGTTLYSTESQGLSFQSSGNLQILLAYDGMVLLKLNDFEYGINPSGQILYDRSDPQFQIVFYLRRYPQGSWVLKINQHSDEVFSCLNEKSYLKEKKKENKYISYSYNKQQEQIQVKSSQPINNNKRVTTKLNKNIKKEELYEENEDLEEDEKQQNKITAKSVIVGASKGLGWGLAFTGKMLGMGIQGVSGLVSKGVKPAAQKVQVSESTKANLQFAKKTTNNVFSFTSKQIGNLFHFGKQMASDIGERFEKTQKGKQLGQNERYGMVKSGASTGVQALANIYDGAVNAMYEIGSGIGKGTSKVVGTKYGDQAGEAVGVVMEGAGNAVKIARIPTDQMYKTFKD